MQAKSIILAITLLLFSLLCLIFTLYGIDEEHLNALLFINNDAVGYITSAKNLYYHGHISSSLLYLQLVNAGFSRLYMPGYYVLLATSFYLFKSTSLYSAIFPSEFGYLLVVLFTYLIGSKLYNIRTGLIAALLTLFNALVRTYSGGMMYNSAFLATSQFSWSVEIYHIKTNFLMLRNFLLHPMLFTPSEFLCIVYLVLFMSLSLVKFKNNFFLIMTNIMVLFVILLCITVYSTLPAHLCRMLLFNFPIMAVCIASVLAERNNFGSQFRQNFLIGSLLVSNLFFSLNILQNFKDSLPGINNHAFKNIALLKSLHISKQGIIVSPWEFSLEYVYYDYPQAWSFIPDNAQSLFILNSQYPINTLIIPTTFISKALTFKDIESIGLKYVKLIHYISAADGPAQIDYYIFQRDPIMRVTGDPEVAFQF